MGETGRQVVDVCYTSEVVSLRRGTPILLL